MSVLEHIKNLLRHSSVYLLSTFIQRALGLIMLPLYTDRAVLPQVSAYGDYALVYTFIAFMTVLYMYGMDLALMRYFFLEDYKRQDVYKTAFLGVLTVAGALSLLMLFGAPTIAAVLLDAAELKEYIYLAAGILFFDSLTNLPYNLLRAEEKSVLFSAVKITRFLSELTLNIVFVVVLKKGVVGILYANLAAAVLNFILLFPYQWKYLKGHFSGTLYGVMLRFALPMLPNGLAYLILEVSDKFLMRFLLNKETLGIYSANRRFGSIMLFIVMAFRAAWQPFFLKIAKESNAKEIYSKVFTYFTLVAAFVVIVVSYFVDYLVRIPLSPTKTVMGSAYWEGTAIIPLVLMAYLFFGLYVNLTAGIYITKKTKWMLLFSGSAAAVNVAGNLYLMPLYGIYGAAMVTLLSYLVLAVTIYIVVRNIYPVHYEMGRVLFILLYTAVMLVILNVYVPGFYLRLLLVGLSPLLFLFGGFFRAEERRFLKGQLIKRFLK